MHPRMQLVDRRVVSRIPLDYQETASHTLHDEACVATHNWPAMRVFTHRTERVDEEGMVRGGGERGRARGWFVARRGCRTQLIVSRTVMIHLGRDVVIVT